MFTKYIVSSGVWPPDVNSVPVGTLWFNKETGKLFILYKDIDSLQWVQVPCAFKVQTGPSPEPSADTIIVVIGNPYYALDIADPTAIQLNPDLFGWNGDTYGAQTVIYCDNVAESGPPVPGFIVKGGGKITRDESVGNNDREMYTDIRVYDMSGTFLRKVAYKGFYPNIYLFSFECPVQSIKTSDNKIFSYLATTDSRVASFDISDPNGLNSTTIAYTLATDMYVPSTMAIGPNSGSIYAGWENYDSMPVTKIGSDFSPLWSYSYKPTDNSIRIAGQHICTLELSGDEFVATTGFIERNSNPIYDLNLAILADDGTVSGSWFYTLTNSWNNLLNYETFTISHITVDPVDNTLVAVGYGVCPPLDEQENNREQAAFLIRFNPENGDVIDSKVIGFNVSTYYGISFWIHPVLLMENDGTIYVGFSPIFSVETGYDPNDQGYGLGAICKFNRSFQFQNGINIASHTRGGFVSGAMSMSDDTIILPLYISEGNWRKDGSYPNDSAVVIIRKDALNENSAGNYWVEGVPGGPGFYLRNFLPEHIEMVDMTLTKSSLPLSRTTNSFTSSASTIESSSKDPANVTLVKVNPGCDYPPYNCRTDVNPYCVEDLSFAWSNCTSMTSFPLLDTSSCTVFTGTWSFCSALTSFPVIDVSNGIRFGDTMEGSVGAWTNCTGLTSFPILNFSNGLYFDGAWSGCTGLTEFPILDLSAGIKFTQAWKSCTGLTEFPALNLNNGTNFSLAWRDCTNLTTFPPNMFDNCSATMFYDAWKNCALNQTSVDGILVSLVTSGVENGTVGIDGGTNSHPGSAGLVAIQTLLDRGWTVNYNQPPAANFKLVPLNQYEQDNGLFVQTQQINPFKFYQFTGDDPNYGAPNLDPYGSFGEHAPTILPTGGPNGLTALAAVLNGNSSTISAVLDETVSQLTQIPYTIDGFINIGESPGTNVSNSYASNGIEIRLFDRVQITYDVSYPNVDSTALLYNFRIYNDFDGLNCYDRDSGAYGTGTYFQKPFRWSINSIIGAPNQWVHFAFTNEPVVGGQMTQSLYFGGNRIYTETGTPYLYAPIQNSMGKIIINLFSRASIAVPKIHGFRYTKSVLYQGTSFTPPTQ